MKNQIIIFSDFLQNIDVVLCKKKKEKKYHYLGIEAPRVTFYIIFKGNGISQQERSRILAEFPILSAAARLVVRRLGLGSTLVAKFRAKRPLYRPLITEL